MSIDDEDLGDESVTENRQLEWFTDRYEFTRLFASYLNDDPPRQNILYFYGDGGNGKSLLLKYLRTFACKRFSRQVWQQLMAMSDRQVAEYIRNAEVGDNYTTIPAVSHDFGLPPIKEDQPQHPFLGLLMLRRNIAAASPKFKFKFPLFDFACFWYLLNKGESPETLQKLFPDDIVNLLTPAIESAAEFPIIAQGVAILKLIDKIGGKERLVKLVRERLGISKEQAEEICRKDIDIELIDYLPKLLAEDLKAAMTRNDKHKPERLVLFFDTHERFWDGRRESQGEKFFYLDEWVRRLLRALPLELGIVVVMAGRDCPIEQLRWCDAGKFPIPQQYLDTQLVWHLSKSDAKDYLQKADITEANLVEALIKYASVNPQETDLQVHPFYIGLCADVVLLERKRGNTLQAADFANIPKLEDKTAELINRLLRYVDREVRYAVHSLSACRTFNDELYFKLGNECHFLATAANFDILKSFSFVWQDKRRGNNWYRIHDLLRRLDDESENATTWKAHEVLETHYREVGNLPEAIYHANRLDWEWGVDEWVREFDAALEKSNYQLCSSLLEVRGELRIASDFQVGRISQSEGNYFSTLARHTDAKQEYLEAVAAYNRELSLTPDDISALNNKGLALQNLGDLQAQLTEFDAAKQSYTNAIASFNSALILAPNDISVLNNKGGALQSLGDLQAQLNEFAPAKQSYTDAIASFNSALILAPDYIYALINKGSALANLGNLQAKLSQQQEAVESWQAALVAFERSLTLAPNNNSIRDRRDKLQEFLDNL
ncbi:MAG TPA: hypothetical protein V6D28_07440 [Leptolyngbyaceae cyanobacterium]